MIQEFKVFGKPVGKGRPRVVRNGGVHAYTPKKTMDYEQFVVACFKANNMKKVSGPVRVDIIAHFPIPKSYSKAKRAKCIDAYYTGKPDTDNIVKAILDALNDVAWEDDSAVMIGGAYKFYTEGDPYVSIRISSL